MPEHAYPHSWNLTDAVQHLETDPERGLERAEARARLARVGLNDVEPSAPPSPLTILVRQLTNVMIGILFVAVAIAVAVWWAEGARGWPSDALVIGAVAVFNVALGFAQEYRAERAIQELKRLAGGTANVVRSGEAATVDRRMLVPGDLVLLGEGDRVPADLLLASADRLQVDESLLTGESTTVAKRVGAVPRDEPVDGRHGMAFAGTTVTAGAARGLVVATGGTTQMGGIAASLAATEAEPTPLELRLAALGRQVSVGVVLVGLSIAASLLALEGARSSAQLLHIAMFAVALAVAAVPEGLPTVLTVSLAIGARRLARRRAVVRRMSAVETLGAVTTIVTDKTGTLTQNRMTVARVVVEGALEDAPGRASPVREMLVTAGALANGADLDERGGRVSTIGDPTDAAFLMLARAAGTDWRAVRAGATVEAVAPFASERRRTSVVARWRGARWLFVKGSLETLEPMLDYVGLTGSAGGLVAEPLDDARRRALFDQEAALADGGYRALAVAGRRLSDGEGIDDERALVLFGLVGLGDPLRSAVPGAVAACRRAGIRIVMLTGDHPRAAATIARAAGLDSDAVLTGREVDALDDAALDAVLARTRVFARVSPHVKRRIAERLMARGEVVAMTGDGVNDAPALKRVHVGVAMGSGTAVAVEASHVVLMDDDFATLVHAIEGGRQVYAAVQKFVAFLFSGNAGVVLAMFAGTVLARIFDVRLAGELLLPLTAAQILWMNLVTDGAPAVAFGLGRTAPGAMDAPPRDPCEPILPARLCGYVLVTGAAVAALLLIVLDAFHAGGLFTLEARSAAYARTAGLFTVVTARLWNALNFNVLPHRLTHPAGWRQRAVPVACLASWMMMLGMLALPAGRELLGLVPLDPAHVVALTALAALVLAPGHLYLALVGLQRSVTAVTERPGTEDVELTAGDVRYSPPHHG